MVLEHHTATPPTTGAAPVSIDTLLEAFAVGLPSASAALDRLTTATDPQRAAEEIRLSLAALRQAFDSLATLAAPGRQPSGHKPPRWKTMHRANPLVEVNIRDTVCLVALHLEHLAYTAEHIRGDGLPHRLGPSLAQGIQVAIAALRIHIDRPKDGEAEWQRPM